jgi:UDP-N-acetylmuramoyl-L-alanyl-D-glutamate--2,6-diaminopimelate ligase
MDPLQSLVAQGAMIERLSSDSRRCSPGSAFFAYPGEKADGRAHIADAVRRGAAAVLWEADGFSWRAQWRLPNVAVAGLKQRAGEIAAEFHGHPSRGLWMCGVTGTNGKTSSSHWLAAALERAGARTGVIGTLGSGFAGAISALVNTTPDALELQAMLAQLRAGGARAVAMEVSSHGLVQGRVNGVRFACALFTNLSHDHLDYHGTMQAYAEAKAALFALPGLQAAVLNLDDEFGLELARRLSGHLRIIGYGLHRAPRNMTSEWLRADEDLNVTSSWGAARLATGQLGRFNAANALGVLGCLLAYGIGFEKAVGLLADLPPVPGRMQAISERPLVVIDYAHTPDALEKVLGALRPVAAQRGGRLVAVFGAGGDRDAAKRPLMGAVAERLADRLVITSDNPRSEPPERIIDAIAAGVRSAARARISTEVDRRRAIEAAVREAAPQDVVLIAGKGHEDYQEIAGERLPFSDQAAARAALELRGSR